MRFFAFILSIMVLVLSIVPCADAHEVELENSHMVYHMEQSGCSHGPTSGCLDLCSPFCHCSCCGGIVLVSHPDAVLSTPILVTNAPYNDFLSKGTIEISLPVWQPPQLA